MTSFIKGVLRFRLLVLAVALGVLTVGVVQLRDAPLDVIPEFTPPYAEIQTEALGLSAEEVEQLITVPLEADLLNGVEGVDVIRSESVSGLSSIVLVFARDTDVYRARQLVEERLTQAHALPNVSRPPTLLPPLSSSSRVLMIGLSTTELTPIEQSVIARWTVRPQLMGVPGVANVAIWGLRDQQLQVQVDPARLRDRKVRLNQVISTAGNAQVVSQLTFLEASTPGTGGFVESPQQRLQVRHLLEKIADPAELAEVPVDGTGGRLKLGDVAAITVDHQPLIGDAVVAGADGLYLVVEKFPGVSTPEVTESVEAALEALRPGLTGISSDTTLFRPADYIHEALDNLAVALLVGGVLMLLGLMAAGAGWRAVVVTAITVPLSVITAALVLHLLGQGLNALVLAGLAAAVAVVVDEAVAPVDAVTRALRRRTAGEAGGLAAVVSDASAGIRRPLIYASLVAGLAIVPVAVLGGRPGAFFAPLAAAYAAAVFSALLVAVTVTPALSAVLFAGRLAETGSVPRRWQRWEDRYARASERFSLSRRPMLLAGAGLAAAAVAVVPFAGVSLLPSFQDRNLLVQLEGPPGASQQRMTQLTSQISGRLADLPGVASVGAHVGRAVTGDRVVNVNQSDVWVTVEPDADYGATVAAIEAEVHQVPELSPDVVSYTDRSMREVGALISGANTVTRGGLDLLTGLDQPVVVRVYGQDPDVLAEQAARVHRLLGTVEGVVDPRVVAPEKQPTIEIEVDLRKAHRFGLTPGDVRRAEATLLQGIQVGSVFQDQKVFDVVVQGAPATRRGVADIRRLLIDRPDGGQVELGQVADVRVVETAAVIRRDAVSRRVDVVAGVRGRGVNEVAAEIEREVGQLAFPMEYHAKVFQQSTTEEVGGARVVAFAIAAAIAALLLFQAAFRSWRLALLFSIALPLTLVGGLIAGVAIGPVLSLGALLGLLAVFGLAARNGLVVITALQGREDGARPVALPVLRSSLAIGLLALPFVILGSRPGLEILHPLAVVLLGGLVTSAFVTLFLLPAAYRLFGPAGAVPVAPDAPSTTVSPAEAR